MDNQADITVQTVATQGSDVFSMILKGLSNERQIFPSGKKNPPIQKGREQDG
jgi:hypothetical protein